MKLKTSIFLLVLSLCLKAQGQNAYYDAVKLAGYVSPVTGKFAPDPTEVDTIRSIFRLYGYNQDSSNAFLKSYLTSGAPFAPGVAGNNFNWNGLSSSLGGLNVTSIANALADLMIDRAKQELTVAFFDRFKDFAKKNPEFGILFPKTTHNLENLFAYKYPEMLPALRSGFLDDLRQITFRLDDVLDLSRYQELFKDLPEVKVAIRSLKLVHELETGASNAADIIYELASYKEWDADNLKVAGGVIKTASLLSQSLRYHGKDSNTQIWVSAKELKTTFFDLKNPQSQVITKIFLGLLYQQAMNDKISLGSGQLSTEIAKYAKPENIDTFYDKLKEFIVLTEKVNVNYRDLKLKLNSKVTISADDYHTYIGTSLDIVEYSFSLAKLFKADVTKAEEYLSILKESNDLYKNIYTKEYNQAITNALDILDKINTLVKNGTNTNVTLVNAESCKKQKTTDAPIVIDAYSIKKITTGYSVTFNSNTLNINSLDESLTFGIQKVFISSDKKNAFAKLLAFIDEVKPYALFIANVVEAKSEDDIKTALDAAILPVGSSSIKKYSKFNISVQSYLGARWNTADNNTNSAWNNKWGVTAPIGFAFSIGTNGGNHNPSSFSLFAALLDIGAIVDYKLTVDSNSQVNQTYEIKLEQIFAPGGFIVYGLPWNLPLAVGMGGQYGPGIYKSNNTINPIQPGWRWNAFIAVDIPFFTLSNKVRNKIN